MTSGSIVIFAYVPPVVPLHIVPGLMQTHPEIFLANTVKSLGVIIISGVLWNMNFLVYSTSTGVNWPAG